MTIEAVLERSTDTRFPLTRIQKLIGRRMLASKLSKPCFYVEGRADVGEILTFRKKLSRQLGVKITTNTFFIRATALAARENPLVLGLLSGDQIRIADSVNVGFAVNAPQGVIVPVIKNADGRSLAEIATLEKRFAAEARSNELDLTDMEGETIAFSNLGAYGMDSFAGIIPPPASTIVTVGNVLREVACVDGEPVSAKRVVLTLSADRRVVDEVLAAKFIKDIVGRIENPRALAEMDVDGDD